VPDELDPTILAASLVRPGLPWTAVRTVAVTGSTNADLAMAARAGEVGGVVLIAGEQRAGRGRLTRTWSSPPGTSLSMSYLLRPTRHDLGVLPLVTGLGVVRGLARLGVAARLKWPNDVLIDSRKVCGILAELVVADDGVAAVVGLGVNVSQTAEGLPVPWATSLALAGVTVTRTEAALAVLTGVGETVLTWMTAGWEALATPYAETCATVGREVRVELSPTDHVVGLATGITTDGRLQVRVGSELRSYAAGDVHHLR
jgi:BirA family biotin operon repressor/biotin-[acetyl-CoA-carboxylase] ligase